MRSETQNGNYLEDVSNGFYYILLIHGAHLCK
jgi:hypothetical protein